MDTLIKFIFLVKRQPNIVCLTIILLILTKSTMLVVEEKPKIQSSGNPATRSTEVQAQINFKLKRTK